MGKTLFINRLLGRPVFKNSDCELFLYNMNEVVLRVRQQEFVEDDFHVRLSVVDAPQVGYSVRKDIGIRAITSYVDDCLNSFLSNEMTVGRTQSFTGTSKEDDRVHVCVYFLSPSQDK